MGMEYDQPWDGNGIKMCGKWELRRGSGKKSLHTQWRIQRGGQGAMAPPKPLAIF